jgi:hypothetical protein
VADRFRFALQALEFGDRDALVELGYAPIVDKLG